MSPLVALKPTLFIVRDGVEYFTQDKTINEAKQTGICTDDKPPVFQCIKFWIPIHVEKTHCNEYTRAITNDMRIETT